MEKQEWENNEQERIYENQSFLVLTASHFLIPVMIHLGDEA